MISTQEPDKLDDTGPDRYRYAEHRDYLFAAWDQLALTHVPVTVAGRNRCRD